MFKQSKQVDNHHVASKLLYALQDSGVLTSEEVQKAWGHLIIMKAVMG